MKKFNLIKQIEYELKILLFHVIRIDLFSQGKWVWEYYSRWGDIFYLRSKVPFAESIKAIEEENNKMRGSEF